MNNQKGLKSIIIAMITLVIVAFGVTMTASAAESTAFNFETINSTTRSGAYAITAYPGLTGADDAYYAVNGKVAFCADPYSAHPTTGNAYYVSEEEIDEEALTDVYANYNKLAEAAMATPEDDDDIAVNQAMVYAVWSKMDSTVNYRLQYKANGGNVEIYNALIASVSDKCQIEVTLYDTDDTTETGRSLQRLVSANVKYIVPDEKPDVIEHVHTVVTDEAVAPTCTETGLTEGSHCSVCGEVLVAQTVVEATGHDYKLVDHKDATCTEAGYDYYECQNDASHNYVEKIPAVGHKAVTDEAVAPTCTKTGLTEGSHCSVCGEVLVAQTVVEATGHDYQLKEHKDATYNEKGYDYYECTHDSSHNYKEEIDKIPAPNTSVVTETPTPENPEVEVLGTTGNTSTTSPKTGFDGMSVAALSALCISSGIMILLLLASKKKQKKVEE